MAGIAKLFDGHIVNKSNEEVDLNDEKYKGKIIGLYFSARWQVLIIIFKSTVKTILILLGAHHVAVLLPRLLNFIKHIIKKGNLKLYLSVRIVMKEHIMNITKICLG